MLKLFLKVLFGLMAFLFTAIDVGFVLSFTRGQVDGEAVMSFA